uniref:RING-type domain-containing protein n=1 Tax=viral metagenome TaxID=1070528 RepID=A0A6C0BDJ0_9ZZZZ
MRRSLKSVKIPDDTSEIADSMDEYSTIPNFESIPTNAFQIPYLSAPLWKHQIQAAYCMLKAEASGPIINDKGEIFYSRSGLLPMPTGTGKTSMVLSICSFPVDEPAIQHTVAGTSLNVIMLNKKKRENIDVTVICSKQDIITNAWIPDIMARFSGLPFYEFKTIGTFEKEALKSPEYIQGSQYIDNVILYIKTCIQNLEHGRINQGQFEMCMIQIMDKELKTVADANSYIQQKEHEKQTLKEKVVMDRIVKLLKSNKIVFISMTSFYFLINVFKTYTIGRLIFDEPQQITIENQIRFEQYIPDRRLKSLRSVGRNVPFYEESPARFIWYISATPYDIPKHVANHYINGWVDKNDFVMNDYINSKDGERLFPELVSQYVIKFPLSYILEERPDFHLLFKKFKLKCRQQAEVGIIRGVLGSEIDNLLENDDMAAVIDKLKVSGTATNILDAAVERMSHDIHILQTRISNYLPNTPKHVVENSNKELQNLRVKLKDIQLKIDTFQGKTIIGNDGIPQNIDCSICFDTMHFVPTEGDLPENRCIVHVKCMNSFHLKCLFQAIAKNKQCPMCREEVKDQKDIKPPYDTNGNNIQNQIIREHSVHQQTQINLDEQIEYDSKLDAIEKALLSPLEINGTYYKRSKILLFINFSTDTTSNIETIVKLIQKCGYSVRLPFNAGTINELQVKYPPIGRATVTCKKENTAINKEMETFKTSPEPFVWLFRSGKESSGLNFPFVDTLIQYSDYGRQVIGRVLRMNRTSPCEIITLSYKDDKKN